MSNKNMKLLRKGAKKFKLPYKALKKAYKKLNPEDREKFLHEARISYKML